MERPLFRQGAAAGGGSGLSPHGETAPARAVCLFPISASRFPQLGRLAGPERAAQD